jgi:hypothetical protein
MAWIELRWGLGKTHKLEDGACVEAFESVRDGREKKRFRG